MGDYGRVYGSEADAEAKTLRAALAASQAEVERLRAERGAFVALQDAAEALQVQTEAERDAATKRAEEAERARVSVGLSVQHGERGPSRPSQQPERRHRPPLPWLPANWRPR